MSRVIMLFLLLCLSVASGFSPERAHAVTPIDYGDFTFDLLDVFARREINYFPWILDGSSPHYSGAQSKYATMRTIVSSPQFEARFEDEFIFGTWSSYSADILLSEDGLFTFVLQSCGSGCTWKVRENGVLVFQDTGATSFTANRQEGTYSYELQYCTSGGGRSGSSSNCNSKVRTVVVSSGPRTVFLEASGSVANTVSGGKCATNHSVLMIAGALKQCVEYISEVSDEVYGNVQVWGQPYKATYESVTPNEKIFVLQHPQSAVIIWNARIDAERNAANACPGVDPRNTKHDAVRHAYWHVLMYRRLQAIHSVATAESLAREFGEIHEDKPDNPPSERSMDRHNNDAGVDYAIANPSLSEAHLLIGLANEVNSAGNGFLEVIDNAGLCTP